MSFLKRTDNCNDPDDRFYTIVGKIYYDITMGGITRDIVRLLFPKLTKETALDRHHQSTRSTVAKTSIQKHRYAVINRARAHISLAIKRRSKSCQASKKLLQRYLYTMLPACHADLQTAARARPLP